MLRKHSRLGPDGTRDGQGYRARAGWTVEGQRGSHVKLTKSGIPVILSIPVHKGKPIKKGLLLDQIKKAGLTVEEFLRYYR